MKDPRILLLDEATSALDAESERIMQEALDRIMVNRTTVIVSHHLSTVRNAHMIAVIQQGKMVEKGTHFELLQDYEGAYSQLIRLQEVSQHLELDEARKADISSDGRLSSKRMSLTRSLSRMSSTVGKSNRRQSLPNTFGVSASFDVGQITLEDSEWTTEKPPKVPIRRLASLNKPEIPALLLGAIFTVINGAIMPIFGILISSVIKTFFQTEHKLRKDSGQLYSWWLGQYHWLHILEGHLFVIAGNKLIRRIRLMCFEKVVNMEVSWFDDLNHSSGIIGARLSADAAIIRALVGDALAQTVQDVSSLIVGLAIAFEASWQLALTILGMLPLIGLNGYIQIKFMKGFSADAKAMYQEATQIENDAVGSIQTGFILCRRKGSADV